MCYVCENEFVFNDELWNFWLHSWLQRQCFKETDYVVCWHTRVLLPLVDTASSQFFDHFSNRWLVRYIFSIKSMILIYQPIVHNNKDNRINAGDIVMLDVSETFLPLHLLFISSSLTC